MIRLGDRVRDPLTGIRGIAYACTSYLQGCDRIGIQQPLIKRKENTDLVPELFFVDEPQLVCVKRSVIKTQQTKNGGPSGFEPSHQKGE